MCRYSGVVSTSQNFPLTLLQQNVPHHELRLLLPVRVLAVELHRVARLADAVHPPRARSRTGGLVLRGLGVHARHAVPAVPAGRRAVAGAGLAAGAAHQLPVPRQLVARLGAAQLRRQLVRVQRVHLHVDVALRRRVARQLRHGRARQPTRGAREVPRIALALRMRLVVERGEAGGEVELPRPREAAGGGHLRPRHRALQRAAEARGAGVVGCQRCATEDLIKKYSLNKRKIFCINTEKYFMNRRKYLLNRRKYF